MLSSERTIVPRLSENHDDHGVYKQLSRGPADERVRRLDLNQQAPNTAPRRSLVHFVQVTDMHVLDAESPGRFEFIEPLYGPQALFHILPCFRPQEALTIHACEAMIRTLNRNSGSTESGAPIQFLLSTGDNTDNAQRNELRWFLELMTGGDVHAKGGSALYEGVQEASRLDPDYWHPDACMDTYKQIWGFPDYPGLLKEAVRPIQAEGLAFPWFSSYGNHDALIIGAALRTAQYDHIVTGSEKPRRLPAEFDPVAEIDSFIPCPERYLAGPTWQIIPDAERRTFDRQQYVHAHLDSSGLPYGHGFGQENLEKDTAYYVEDGYEGIRLIVLDTSNPCGHHRGSIGRRQCTWLEDRLVEVHGRYIEERGRWVSTGHDDRLVIVACHHPLRTLDAPLDCQGSHSHEDLPRLLAPHLTRILHRFPNVVLVVNGHTHRNTIIAHRNPEGRTAGFWEVTTSSIIDWPCQSRLIEILDNGDGTLSILCTMVDHDSPLVPTNGEGVELLATIHRELAANDPHAGWRKGAQGNPLDRTVDLVIPAPFAIR